MKRLLILLCLAALAVSNITDAQTTKRLWKRSSTTYENFLDSESQNFMTSDTQQFQVAQ